jgi:hypothetical protein
MIGHFLSDYRKSDGGWGEVTPEDVELLRRIIRKLIRLKANTDPDGCPPIEVTVVDRTVYESLQYEEVPYCGQGRMRILIGNLSRAFSRLDDEYRCQLMNEDLKRLPPSLT